MKRIKKIKNNKVIVKKAFPVVWTDCTICKKEFMFESGLKVTFIDRHCYPKCNGYRFICGECKEFNSIDRWEEILSNSQDYREFDEDCRNWSIE